MFKKILVIILILGVLAIGFFVFMIYKEKTTPFQEVSTTINPEMSEKQQNGENKLAPEEMEKLKEAAKEKPADPQKVAVFALEGNVVEINKESITIKNGDQEQKHSLAQGNELGIFRRTVDQVAIISLEDVKIGDYVKLEARHSDKAVNVIMVE